MIDLTDTNNSFSILDVGYQLQGRWNDWSDWTQCTKTCGKGTKKRTRSCGSKPKENGGFPCEGPRTQWNVCNTNVCIGNENND